MLCSQSGILQLAGKKLGAEQPMTGSNLRIIWHRAAHGLISLPFMLQKSLLQLSLAISPLPYGQHVAAACQLQACSQMSAAPYSIYAAACFAGADGLLSNV